MGLEGGKALTMAMVLMALAFLVVAPAQGRSSAIAITDGPGPVEPRRPAGLWDIPLKHENLTANVHREVSINYTLVFVKDEITLNATGKARLDSFLYGIPLSWSTEVGAEVFYISVDGEEIEEPWEHEVRLGDLDFRGFLINLTEPLELEANETAIIEAQFVLNGSLRFLGASDYEVRIPLAPCTSLYISNLTFRLTLPEGAGITSLEPGGMERRDSREVLYSAVDLGEFYTKVALVRFRLPEAIFLMYCPSATRVLELDPMSGVRISDTYELVNNIGSFVDHVDLLLPKKASAIKASDLMGELKVKVKEAKGFKKVRIALRGQIGKGNSITITVSYTMPWDKYVIRKGPSDFLLRHRLEQGLNWPVEHMLVKIVLPQGARITSSSHEPAYIKKGFLREEVGFLFYMAMPLVSVELKVHFSYSVFWPSLKPTLWASLAGLIGCALIKLLAPPAVVAPTVAVPIEVITKFVEAYERKMRLRDELVSLREALRKKKISRKRFRTRTKAIGDELARLEKEIANLMAELRTAGGLISELVRDLEVAESELESVERDLRTLEARYTRKEIGSDAYRRLLREYRRREDRAYTAIREVLLRLKELAT